MSTETTITVSAPTYRGDEPARESIPGICNHLFLLEEELRYVLQNLGPENFNEAEFRAIVKKLSDLSGKQELITATGVLKGDGAGNISAAVPGADYAEVFLDTEAGWNSQTTLIARAGAIYIYTDHGSAEVDGATVPVPGVKIGDGTSYLIDMAFVAEDTAQQLQEHIANATVHITAAERQEWNNKVTCYISAQDTECLVFQKTTT